MCLRYVTEINQRSEFLTAYAGEPYADHGRFQALFEYQSLMAELLDVDVVNVPTYDWAQAAATSPEGWRPALQGAKKCWFPMQ